MTINENAQNLRQQYLKIIENVDRDSQSEVNLLLGIRTQLLEKFDSQRKKVQNNKKIIKNKQSNFVTFYFSFISYICVLEFS